MSLRLQTEESGSIARVPYLIFGAPHIPGGLMSTLSTPRQNPTPEEPDRNLALELVRVTEAAAMAAGRWVGRGDKNGGDQAGVEAKRQPVGPLSLRGDRGVGEGGKIQGPCVGSADHVHHRW